MVCVSVGACVCGVCTQMCTHEEARRSALLYHSLLYSLRQSLLLSPSLGLQPVDGSSAPFATPHSTTGFSHQFRGLTLRVSGLSGYCPHHWVVSPSPGHYPSWGSLSHKHMAGDPGELSPLKWEDIQVEERTHRAPAFPFAAVSPMGPGFLGSVSEGGSNNLLF